MYRLLELNPQLQDFAWDIDYRMQLYRDTKARLLPHGGELNDFASAHNYFGIHHVDGGWVYREWAPSAYRLYLTGEFTRRRSLWMVTAFICIVVCIVVSLLLGYPSLPPTV